MFEHGRDAPQRCIARAGAGKSSLLIRFADEKFDDTLQSTVGVDFKLKHITLLWQRVRLQLWDTNGQERFRSITRAYYRGAHGVALVYDVCEPESFHNVARWITDIREHATVDDIVVILVANKVDLAGARAVSSAVGRQLAEECGCEYFETSAKTGLGVDEAFTSVAEHIMCGGSRRQRRRLLLARQRLLWACAAADAGLPSAAVSGVAQQLMHPQHDGSPAEQHIDQVLMRQEQQRFEAPPQKSGTPRPRRTREPVVIGRVALGGPVSLRQTGPVQDGWCS